MFWEFLLTAFIVCVSPVYTLSTALGGGVKAGVASAMRRRVMESPSVMTWMRRAFAASFAALGARLALGRA